MRYRVQLGWRLVPAELSLPDMILLVCAYICFSLWSAQPSTYHYCASQCKPFLFLFLHLERRPPDTCQDDSGRRFVELENQSAGNNQNNTNDGNNIQSWQLQKGLHVEWSHLFRWWGVHTVRSGFFPRSPPNCCNSVWALADSKFTTLLKSLKAAVTSWEEQKQNRKR